MSHHVPSYPGSPHEDHWPSYDPIGHHHHPKHPPYMVDRCADECDDQLPLLSQVGRGLEGRGYNVEVSYDDTDETYLTGYYTDPHTGESIEDWTSKNINGGRLYYSYHIRNFTDPQTFTITFRYVRPNRDADEEGTVWSWTSPAIPYVGDEDMGDLIASWVSTLYLRKNGEAWNWRDHEKLTYPEGMTHQSVNAPDPNEGWTVNLTYGLGKQEDDPTKDCDIQVPTLQELAKIIGMKPEWILELLEEAIPTDVIPRGMNVKEYIDNRIESVDRTYNVTSTDTGLLDVNKTTSGKQTNFALTPYAPLAGQGIKVERNAAGRPVISTNLLNGYGIQLQENGDGSITIINTQVGGKWDPLVPGTDFDYTWHNGWYCGIPPVLNDGEHGFITNPSEADKHPPRIEIIPSYDPTGKLIGGEMWIGSDWANNIYFQCANNLMDLDRFKFKHSLAIRDALQSVVLSVTFKGKYANLNKTSVIRNGGGGSIWNVKGSNDEGAITSPNVSWHNVGACWTTSLYINKDITDASGNPIPGYRKFVFGANSIADGYNDQYTRPPYGCRYLVIAPWANWDHYFTLGNYTE